MADPKEQVESSPYVGISFTVSAKTARLMCRSCQAMRASGASEEEIEKSHNEALAKLFDNENSYYCDTDKAAP